MAIIKPTATSNNWKAPKKIRQLRSDRDDLDSSAGGWFEVEFISCFAGGGTRGLLFRGGDVDDVTIFRQEIY